MAQKKWLIVGIDVGTTKICTAIARQKTPRLEVLGSGWAPSRGLRKGVVVNLSETVASVKSSLEEAEEEARSLVESAYVSVGGSFMRSRNSSGQTEVRAKSNQVSGEDIHRAVAEAKRLELPSDYEVVHALTQRFRLDGHNDVVNPLGMTGRNLSVTLHLVFNASSVVQNIVNAINKSDVIVTGVAMQQLASGEAVLTEDEKELGSVLVDLGGGTTDIAIYRQGYIFHSEVIPLGGTLITKDIAIGLKAPLEEAEELKKEVGAVFAQSVPEEEIVEVTEVGTGRRRSISRRLLCQIVEARADEILTAVAKVIQKAGVQSDLITGAVLTGGGSLLEGLPERAEQILGLPVRIGLPTGFVTRNETVFSPAYSTALGLLKYAEKAQDSETTEITKSALLGTPRAATERLKNWIIDRIG
jgi:cell division protein FtsA